MRRCPSHPAAAAPPPILLCFFALLSLQDVVAISARPYGQRAVLKFAQYTGCLSIAGRFTPGTFTNQITKQFREPRLLIITDPRPDAQVRVSACCARADADLSCMSTC